MASSVSDSVAGDSAAAFSSYTFLKNEKRVHRRLPFGPTSLYSEPVTGSMIIGWSTSLSDPKVRPRRPRSPRASRRQRNLAPAALAESRQRATSGRRARARAGKHAYFTFTPSCPFRPDDASCHTAHMPSTCAERSKADSPMQSIPVWFRSSVLFPPYCSAAAIPSCCRNFFSALASALASAIAVRHCFRHFR